jgi:uncharacterized protein (TIGR03437 family)
VYAANLVFQSPNTLAGVSATVNGLPAAVEYASPGQVNVLVPFEIPAGSAILALNNNGQVASYVFPVTLAAPGIFVDGNGFLAGASNAPRGSEIAFTLPARAMSRLPFRATPPSRRLRHCRNPCCQFR